MATYYTVYVDCYSFQPTNLTRHSLSSCLDDDKNPIHFENTFKILTHNRMLLNGEFTFKEYVTGPIEVKTNLIIFQMKHYLSYFFSFSHSLN